MCVRVSQVAHHRELVVALPALASLEELAAALASLRAAIAAYESARAEYEAMTQVERERTRENDAREVLARLEAILADRRANRA